MAALCWLHVSVLTAFHHVHFAACDHLDCILTMLTACDHVDYMWPCWLHLTMLIACWLHVTLLTPFDHVNCMWPCWLHVTALTACDHVDCMWHTGLLLSSTTWALTPVHPALPTFSPPNSPTGTFPRSCGLPIPWPTPTRPPVQMAPPTQSHPLSLLPLFLALYWYPASSGRGSTSPLLGPSWRSSWTGKKNCHVNEHNCVWGRGGWPWGSLACY